MSRDPLSRLLPEGWLAGPMPWVIAAMAFLAGLSLASGFALNTAARGLGEDLARRATVQIVTADAPARDRQAAAALVRLKTMPSVAAARALGSDELDTLLAPWLGPGASRELPMPAMIDVTLRADAAADMDALARALAAVAPDARIDRHDAALAPLAGLVKALRLVAGVLAAIVVATMGGVIGLATRSALDSHRETVAILHLLGATDAQVARLFARRLAIDAAVGAAVGVVAAATVLLLLGRALAALDSGLAAMAAPGWPVRIALIMLAPAVALLAAAAARTTVVRALRRVP
ncbi:cell division protein FtsX [Sphingomonas quercus]|uniref:Cell division protein n=1 Tax=Sphingomonas quercus TaxID=2842451 RepID=A0ABS6BGP1_9SPHN|nr:FtsX-like permease family protein [Sphingomonas quercus]MBU3076977.1 cell division protein [Sphingomonas quercus]